MTEKRFNLVGSYLYDGEECVSHFNDPCHRNEIVDLLNQLNDENMQLKQQLKDYYNAFDCNQCEYHNYDWFGDGDEFEVCDKGNHEELMYNHSCKDWEEL